MSAAGLRVLGARVAGAIALVAVLSPAATGYVTYNNQKWGDGSAVMHLQLGPGGPLIDGNANWGQAAEGALAMWNPYIDRLQFRVARDSTSGIGANNGISNVFWSSTIHGMSFQNFDAYALFWSTGGRITEGDVIFNTAFSWNSYRGAHRGSLRDFRRVAVHEFGHVLGLNHPNQAGQNVFAIMNSDPNYVAESPASDDISGVQFLYSFGGTGSVSFPARNESLDFRNQLETKYRDGLRRGMSNTFVDREGDIVWTSEYYRYRVNACSHSQAQTRVFSQIDNTGTYGVCGLAGSGPVAFPPRNESLDFRNALEVKYRDGLRRGASQSAVDLEGDVVWIQEYLRYRVNACSHAVSIDKVFAQIDGRGVQPVCQ